MHSVSDAIAQEEARQRNRSRRVMRIVAGWMALVAVALLCANVRNYQALTTTPSPAPAQVADSIVEEAAWQAGYEQWLDTVDGGRWAR